MSNKAEQPKRIDLLLIANKLRFVEIQFNRYFTSRFCGIGKIIFISSAIQIFPVYLATLIKNLNSDFILSNGYKH
jgi:hypothetical protein